MTPRRPVPGPARPRQSGAALLTAMIIVALVATLAVSMVWQQWRAVQVEAAERARAQSSWLLTAAFDAVRLTLSQSGKNNDDAVLLSTPLGETRVSSFLAADQNNNAEDTGPDAFVTGAIADAQARYNLSRLSITQPKEASDAEAARFTQLCETLGVAGDVAGRIVSGMRHAAAGTPGDDGNVPLLPGTVAQLAWLGVDADALRVLEPYVEQLNDSPMTVNVNTASPQVLAAVLGIDGAQADRIAQTARRDPYEKPLDAVADLPGLDEPAKQRLSQLLTVKSSYFLVQGRLRWSDRIIEERLLVKREPNRPYNVTVKRRERVALRDSAAT